jgi:hypothetical protein
MDDDRPIQPDDLDASLDRVRPHAARLLRLATIATGDPAAGVLVAAAAVRAAWRDSRRLPAENLPGALEARLISAFPAAGPRPATRPLDRALTPLGRAERRPRPLPGSRTPTRRRWPSPGGRRGSPGPGRLGRGRRGRDRGLDGPLAGWDPGVLRTALAAAAGPGTRSG